MNITLRYYLTIALLCCSLFVPTLIHAQSEGVSYRYYEGEWERLPDFSALDAVKTGTLSNFSLSPAEQEDFYGFTYRTYLEVRTAGEYTFYTNSDDGSQLSVNGQLVVNNNGRHAVRERSGTVTLDEGRHLIEAAYFEATRNQLLEVGYAGPGISKQLIPDGVLFVEDDKAAPSCDEVLLETQAEVDAFDCATVGDLTIRIIGDFNDPDPITDLSGLSSLVRIEGDLSITANTLFGATIPSNLEGFNNLESIGGDFRFNVGFPGPDSFFSFEGLDKLTSIGGSFIFIGEAPSFEDFTGLESLTSVEGDLRFTFFSVEDFVGLSGLKKIGGEIELFGTGETRFTGLSALESVGGFTLPSSASVPDFMGLESLKIIDGPLSIFGGDGGVISFRGLENLETITGDVTLEFEDDFEGWEGLGNLRRIGGSFLTFGSFDDFSGLESLEEVGSLLVGNPQSLQGLEQLRLVQGTVSIEGTDRLTDISALKDLALVGGDFVLTGNLQLSDCCAVSDVISKVEGEVVVENNALGCSSLPAIEEACNTPSAPLVTATAGTDQTVEVDIQEPLILSGRASGPNPFRQYQWIQVSGPEVRTENASTANLRLFDLQVGTYVFQFTATDSKGNSGSDETTLTVTGGNVHLANSALKTDFLQTSSDKLTAYPNPANGELKVQIPGTEALSGELVIADLSGRRVQRSIPTEVSGRTYQLDIRALPAGIYLLQWQADRLYTARVLVER